MKIKSKNLVVTLALISLLATVGCEKIDDKPSSEIIENPNIELIATLEEDITKEDIELSNKLLISKYYNNYTLFGESIEVDENNEDIVKYFSSVIRQNCLDLNHVDKQRFCESVVMPYIVSRDSNDIENLDVVTSSSYYGNVVSLGIKKDNEMDMSNYVSFVKTSLHNFSIVEFRNYTNCEITTSVGFDTDEASNYISYIISNSNCRISVMISNNFVKMFIGNSEYLVDITTTSSKVEELFNKIKELAENDDTFDLDVFIANNKEYLITTFGEDISSAVNAISDNINIENRGYGSTEGIASVLSRNQVK